MEKAALLKQEKGSRILEHKNQQKHISFVDNRIAAMQRRSNMLSVIQKRVAYSTEYCDNINSASQKFNELDSDLHRALYLAKVNFWNQYGKNDPDKHRFVKLVEKSMREKVADNFIYAAWGQYVEYFLNGIVDSKNSWERQKNVGNHRPDYYQAIAGGELYADLTSASKGGGKHITSKLGGVTFTQPVCAADIMYDDNAINDCLTNSYDHINTRTGTESPLIHIRETLSNFSLNLYELKVEELKEEEFNLEDFEPNEALKILQKYKQTLSLKDICNKLEFGFYQTPKQMVFDIQRVFSSWNILINEKPSPIRKDIASIMGHVMGVINSHIKKILNAPTWAQRMQTLQNRLASIQTKI